ncbi:adenylosuccinate synthase [Caldicoprobacter guelmensis]|uniref:adenylosuccinate synthase n=1 Tax=Caldicoprobacter guelmensis TaxID=1170224 RepID=UPI0019574AD7|nr:adenylosuccinate synthase [Caldicoprobacter guelmensis]MBM7582372.1 adenylosuccinate synthase [Caldicoprobacter guelmensis]
MVKAIVGANWGDEGKGKITDMLAAESDIVVRFQGGSNAGHTIINTYGKFALHMLPSGVFYQHVTNVLGPGVALNIEMLVRELKALEEKGVPRPNILISDRAEVVMPWHILLDRYEEERLGSRQFGSTKSGIAPFYSDKYYKIGIQVCDLYYPDILKGKIDSILEVKNIMLKTLYDAPPIDGDKVYNDFLRLGQEIEDMVGDTTVFLHKAIKEGKRILLEGQLGALKDPDHGIYPYTTSSSPLAGFAAVGAGIPPYEINEIIAVVKAYSTCVGAGPFVTEIFGEQASELRERGGDAGEYGATTGRPRRMGWFDAVATRYGCSIQGATSIALTLLDVLGYLDEIPVCVAYDIEGDVTQDFPVTPLLPKAKPVYRMFPGWRCDIREVRKYSDLPDNAKRYVEFIEEFIGIPIKMISNGPRRENIILR